jgi:hypothetical protein
VWIELIWLRLGTGGEVVVKAVKLPGFIKFLYLFGQLRNC